MSDYMQGYSEGFDEGRAVGKTEIAIILQDLIAELRGEMWKGEDMDAEPAIDRAERRLREVTRDE